jgi:hypothetical protein
LQAPIRSFASNMFAQSLLAGGLMALICTAGHAIAERKMFYQPTRSALATELHAGILTGLGT